MIVNWKKENAGILTIPCMQKGSVEEYVILLPGHNYVTDSQWAKARPVALRKIEAGDIVEYVEKRTVKKGNDIKIKTKTTGEINFEDNFPYNEILTVMKGLGISKPICQFKKEQTGKLQMTKVWLLDYLKTDIQGIEYWDQIKEQFLESDNENDMGFVSIELDEFASAKAEKIILDTYNLETLNYWHNTIDQPDLRVAIKRQIEDVEKPQPHNKRA